MPKEGNEGHGKRVREYRFPSPFWICWKRKISKKAKKISIHNIAWCGFQKRMIQYAYRSFLCCFLPGKQVKILHCAATVIPSHGKVRLPENNDR